MKKLTIIVLTLIAAYFLSVFVTSELSERKVEKYMASLLPEISRPWSAKRIRHYCSEWFCTQAKPTPERIEELFSGALGSFQEFVNKPDCVIQFGVRKTGYEDKMLVATCEFVARFEKETAYLKVHFTDKMRPLGIFELIGESWKLDGFSDIKF